MPHSSTAARRGSARSPEADVRPPRDRLWIHFVNTDAAAQGAGGDLLRDFDALVAWLHERGGVDDERAGGVLRRALLQPAAAAEIGRAHV